MVRLTREQTAVVWATQDTGRDPERRYEWAGNGPACTVGAVGVGHAQNDEAYVAWGFAVQADTQSTSAQDDAVPESEEGILVTSRD